MKKITVQTLPNGYALNFDGDRRNGYMYFNVDDLLKGFMIHIGKPLFPITFSVSMPIEMITFLSLGLLSTIIYTAKLVYYSVKKA
jgi:hypothetical protein